MAEKGGKGHSLPGKAAKSSLKSTTPNGASAKGKDDGSGKPKKGRKVQFDSEGLGDGIFWFSSGSKADSLLKMSVSEFIIFGLFLWIYCLAVPCGFGCLRCVICYLLRADYFVLAICVFSLVNLGKGGKGDKTGRAAKSSAPKEQPPLELRVEQELPKHAKCLMDCEAAEILQGIQEQMVVLSEDPTVKIPV
ncbi:uncharacterized protein LOC104452609 [Eucalyptus grandis]|uniref:uncharacterized protein LOC104452609 n=1 Tax=Eucalyptus grandis TaxID=71139 RepID=UPI00192F0EF4|nr:uncharacterized protein LOC104452609 [Eucalyptus grandis]